MEVDDGDDMEMTPKELEKWIRQKVEKSELVHPEALKMCQQLQALLERREKQATAFLELCESVVECEAVMKRLYCLLGWEYRDTDSDEEGVDSPNSVVKIDEGDDEVIDCDYMPQSPYEAIQPETEAPSSLTTHGHTPPSLQQDSKTQDTDKSKTMQREEGSSSLHLMKDAVVVLTKLPKHKIYSALRPTMPQPQCSSEEEDVNSYDSDTLWKTKDESSDFDYANPGSMTKSKKKRGTHQKTGKLRKADTTKTSTPQAKTDTNTNATHDRTTPQRNTKTTPSQTNTNVATGQKPNTEQICPAVVSSFSKAPSHQATEPPPGFPEEEVSIGMMVLARRRFMKWQWGKIVEIITKDGRLKYKVDLEERGRYLVSGHHIAFDHIPILEQLYIGARVVAKYQQGNQSWFGSGVLGELPSIRNRRRFLVFFDDHTFSYLDLTCFHLVCRPLKNALEDIPDSTHRKFIEDYLKVWPYPSLIQYKAGQSIKVEYKGVQKRCKVKRIDSSLVHVVFQDDQHMEWIYRGSIRLEHIASMRKHLDEVKEKRMDKPDSKPTVTV